MLAVFGAMTAGGAVYALGGTPAQETAPQTPGQPTVATAPGPSAPAAPPTDPARIALKAADDSRTMFTLLSNAVTTSTAGMSTAMAGVPQVFDSVTTARAGADEVAAGLAETETASAALDQVSASAKSWSGTIGELQSLSGMAVSIRTNAVQLRTRLVAQPTPDAAATVAQLDQLIAATDGLSALGAADGLATSLTSLTQAASSSSTSLGRARIAARSLRDGLATIEKARPQALAATTNLSTGLRQLDVALRSIDAQLALVQTKLRESVDKGSETPALAVSPVDPGTRWAWSLCAAGAAGAILSLAGLGFRARPEPAPQQTAAPLADLARAISEIPTPSHGFARPESAHTDPWLPVQFSREN